MPDLRSPFRAAHLVMWSSPLLLLILVFTLTNASNTPTTSSTQISSTTTFVATHNATSSTTTTERATTHQTAPIVVSTTSVPFAAAPSETYVTPTSSIAKSIALAPNKNVSSGALAGTLSVAQPVVDIPLEGPGSWSIATSAPALEVLACGGSTQSVAVQFTITLHQSCQLVITSTNHEVRPSWRLIPTP
ncbi:MAG: hypothetical protein HIU84_03410 [Acidobacteria bacterium]|nr:hypothetical protein [Acidobacteriota bacterium]